MIKDLWYKNAVIYCLSVGTYMDANGDGIGDFQGLMRRLDYLHGLGTTAIWLMPFQCSPGRDDGYDISDYYGVNPAYGTLGDFVDFTHAAKQRGIGVVFITHNARHAMLIGDRFVVFNQGTVAAAFRRGEKSREEILNLMAGGEQEAELANEFSLSEADGEEAF